MSPRENSFVRRKTRECWDVFGSIQLLCFLNEALEHLTNKIETDFFPFFVCVMGEMDIGGL